MCCLLVVSCDVGNTAQPSSPRGEETLSATNAVTGSWESSQVCEVGPLPGVSGFLYLWGKNRRLSRLPPSANATLNLFLISQLRPSPEARCLSPSCPAFKLAAGLLVLSMMCRAVLLTDVIAKPSAMPYQWGGTLQLVFGICRQRRHATETFRHPVGLGIAMFTLRHTKNLEFSSSLALRTDLRERWKLGRDALRRLTSKKLTAFKPCKSPMREVQMLGVI